MEANMRLSYLKNVVTLSLAANKCIGCGKCTEVCPHGVFSANNGTARIVRRDSCMECGACALNCPVKAIEVNAGVGCAAAIIQSWFKGGEPTCDCSGGECC
jgi:NAD-dependent dihydropyrimidine dehydrogenase PreA subunit